MSAGAIFQLLFGKLMDMNWEHQFLQPGLRLYPEHAYLIALFILPITFFAAFILSLLMKETNCRNITKPD
ncbi:MAG: hypothetical protein AAGA27_08690 [Pseudomonadota bacterium]